MSTPFPPDNRPHHLQDQPTVTVRFHLDERGILAGAHTVPLHPSDPSPQVAVQLSSLETTDTATLGLTVPEAHGLLMSWHAQIASEAAPTSPARVTLPTDNSALKVTFATAVAAADLAWVDLPGEVPVVLATHTITPAAPRSALSEPYLGAARSLTDALRALAGLPALGGSDEVAFDADETYAVTTPLVEAVLATVPSLDVSQVVAGHFIWNGILEHGYRPDISFHTLETLAARAGRTGATAAAFSRASDLAVELLGSHSPTPLLQEATSLVVTATGAELDERGTVELTQAVAESFFRHLQVVVASAVIYDVAPADDIQPPLRAWLMALEGPGEEFDPPAAP